MKKSKKFVPAVQFAVLLAVGLVAEAKLAIGGASGVEFTEEEITASGLNAKLISETAAACLNRTYDTHLKFYQKRGYSKFYGNRNPKHKDEGSRTRVLLGLLPALRQKVASGNQAAISELQARLAELEATSCIGLAMDCLGEGFKKAEMGNTWDKIFKWVGRIGTDGTYMFYGTDLQKALVDIGWKSIYWNPDLSQNEAWDKNEADINPLQPGQVWNPIWGGHAYRWAMIKKTREYYGIPVQDIQTLVNFGIRPPEEFKRVPFYLGTAHAGYHVFPGMHGKVIEAHSMRELKSKENLEIGEFNPLNQPKNGMLEGNGSPKWTSIEHYRSGMIVVPPGYISEKPFVAPAAARGAPHFMPHKPHPGHNDRENEMWGRPGRWNPFEW